MSQIKLVPWRRGDLSQGELIVLLIVIVSFVIVLMVFGRIFKNFDAVEELTCGAQVREAHFRNTLMGRDEALNITNCQTQFITIKRAELPEDFVKADKEVKKKIANQMVLCWRSWGEGELDLFKKAGDYCAPCADITFDEELRTLYNGKTNGQLDGFPKYLAETTVPGTKPPLKYIQVLTGKTVNDGDITEELKIVQDLDLSTDKGFSILYTHRKTRSDDTIIRKVSDLTGTDITPQNFAAGAGVTAGVVEIVLSWPKSVGVAGVKALWTEGKTVRAVVKGVRVGGGYTVSGIDVLRESAVTGRAVGGLAYLYARANEEFTVTSATYITPIGEDNYYGRACTTLGSPVQSP